MKILKVMFVLLGSLILPLNTISSLKVKAETISETITVFKPISIAELGVDSNVPHWNRVGFAFNLNSSIDVSTLLNVKLTYQQCNLYLFVCLNWSNADTVLYANKNVDFGGWNLGNNLPQAQKISYLKDYMTTSSDLTYLYIDKVNITNLNLLDNYDFYLMFSDESVRDVVTISITYLTVAGVEETDVCVGSNCALGDNAGNDPFAWSKEMFANLTENLSFISTIIVVFIAIVLLKYTLGWLPTLGKLALKLIPFVVRTIKLLLFIAIWLIKLPFKIIGKILGINKDKDKTYYSKNIKNKYQVAYQTKKY